MSTEKDALLLRSLRCTTLGLPEQYWVPKLNLILAFHVQGLLLQCSLFLKTILSALGREKEKGEREKGRREGSLTTSRSWFLCALVDSAAADAACFWEKPAQTSLEKPSCSLLVLHQAQQMWLDLKPLLPVLDCH